MTLISPHGVASAGGQSADSNTLIDLYMFSDDGRFTDNNAGSVVHEEILADGGARVNIDAGLGVGIFGHHSGDHGNFHQIQFMSQPAYRACHQTRIGKNDFILVICRRVSVIGGLNIRIYILADHGDPAEVFPADLIRLRFDRFIIAVGILRTVGQCDLNLRPKIVEHVLDEDRHAVVVTVTEIVALTVIAGEENRQKFVGDINDHLTVRLLIDLHAVDVSAQSIVFNDGVGQFLKTYVVVVFHEVGPQTN